MGGIGKGAHGETATLEFDLRAFTLKDDDLGPWGTLRIDQAGTPYETIVIESSDDADSWAPHLLTLGAAPIFVTGPRSYVTVPMSKPWIRVVGDHGDSDSFLWVELTAS